MLTMTYNNGDGMFGAYKWLTPYDSMLPAGVQSMPEGMRYRLTPAPGTSSGFKSRYREGDTDQVHHFAVYFQYDAQLRDLYKENGAAAILTAMAASAVGELIQRFTGGSVNWQDYHLGADAAILGASYAAGVFSAAEIGNRIEREFCDPDWKAR